MPDPEWGQIKRDVIFEISLPSISKSYYATPDATGHKPVKVEKVKEGRYRIISPKVLLRNMDVYLIEIKT